MRRSLWQGTPWLLNSGPGNAVFLDKQLGCLVAY